MTLEVRLRPEAEQDLADAAAWYQEQRAGLGLEFLQEAQVVLSSIAERPLSYQVVHRAARRALLRRFPFGVFYRVEPSRIVVIGILHGSRDPGVWKGRP
jgi:plasmid stabilization system protein ParE